MNGSTSMESKYLNINRKQMEVSEPLNLENRRSHRQLTPLRAFRGILCLVMLISTAFMMMVYLAPVTTLLVRLFSVHYSRKYTSFLFAAWLSLWPFLFEKINKTKVVFSGETLPMKNRVLLFANHRTEVDWLYLWDLALRKGHLGSLKYILKSSLMKLPIFGWSFQIMEFIAVERKWEIDETIMRKKLLSFKDPQDPLWLVVFPEGTDYTEKKCIKSQQFAAENGLPILKNVLIPKTKGICACLESLRDSLDAVFDITIAYKHRCPTLVDNLFGVDPSEVHIHAQQLQLHEIPTSENEVANWLIERFRLKDQLLSDFTTRGYFPNQGTEGELSTLACLVRCLAVIFITSYFMYLSLFSSIWFKIYVAFSCAYLSFATYFNVLPSPLYNCAKALFCGKRKNM